jgi:hypothetical protein
MNTKLPSLVEKLLRDFNSQKTLSYIRRCNISDVNWRIFCLAKGRGIRKKQKEIAVEYSITASRVSAIVRDVLKRLELSSLEPNNPRIVHAYRTSRCKLLKNVKVVNAEKVCKITELFRSDRCDKAHKYIHLDLKCKVNFFANHEQLFIVGKSRLDKNRGDRSTEYWDQYAVFWAKKYEAREEQDAELIQDAEHIFVSFERDFRHPNKKMVYVSWPAFLLIDYNEEFWVIDKVNIHENKESIDIHLKLAVFE